MTLENTQTFFKELERRRRIINDYILDKRFVSRFQPDDVQLAVTAYIRYGGKRLRPAILLFSCGAVGGDEKLALPAAAAVEIFHTWTLVHDDIIDRDPIRRGSSTVHYLYAESMTPGEGWIELTPEEAHHYGVSVAILTGDIQHGWGISMMTELTTKNGVSAEITIDLIDELDTRVLNTLVEGEVLDIQYAHRDIEVLTPELIEDMLWKKTGALYEFCGRAGAMIGIGRRDDPRIDAVARFTALCGTAFQLQDDILGIIGKEEKLGKPIGSDLREGKRTLVVYRAYHNATKVERKKMMAVLGNQSASDEEINEVILIMKKLGGIEYVTARAKKLIEKAQSYLDILPDTHYKELLWQWSEFLVNREF